MNIIPFAVFIIFNDVKKVVKTQFMNLQIVLILSLNQQFCSTSFICQRVERAAL